MAFRAYLISHQGPQLIIVAERMDLAIAGWRMRLGFDATAEPTTIEVMWQEVVLVQEKKTDG